MSILRPIAPAAAALAVCAVAAAPAPAVTSARYFHSPSGNIRCHYTTPPAAIMCLSRSTGRVAAVSRYGNAFTTTNSGGFRAGVRLGYGRRWKRASLVCVSRRSGMTCYSRITTYGFTISRGGITLF